MNNELQKLHHRLIKDIKKLQLPTDFTLDLRGYSKTYNGRYMIKDKKIVIYPYMDSTEKQLLSYNYIFKTLLHELVHHYQYVYQTDFVRYHGVAHSPQFYNILDKWEQRAYEQGVLTVNWKQEYSFIGGSTTNAYKDN